MAADRDITGRNVQLVLIFVALAFVARSVWTQQMASYVYISTGGSSSMVGYLTGVMGLAQVVLAPVGGLLGDKLHRRGALSIAGVLGLAAAAVMALAVALGGHYGALCIAGVMWGFFWAVCNPSIEAVFADSVPDGSRTKALTTKYVITLVASAAGPALALLMFLYLGDQWTKRACAAVILAGVGLSVVPTALLFFFRDVPHRHSVDSSLTEPLLADQVGLDDSAAGRKTPAALSSSSDDEEAARDGISGSVLNAKSSAAEQSLLNVGNGGGSDASNGDAAAAKGSALVEAAPAQEVAFKWRGRGMPIAMVVPAGVALSDVLSGLASGMSIKFFPLFFQVNIGLDPVGVNAIYAAAPLATAAASFAAGRVAHKLRKRAGVVLASKVVGIVLLAALCELARFGAQAWMIVCVFLVRTSFMNLSKPLTRAMIMDLVPRHQRARWSALESVNMATWSGSAVLGGILVDRYGVLSNFYATALLQLLALGPLFFVRQWEPKEGTFQCQRRPPPVIAGTALSVRRAVEVASV